MTEIYLHIVARRADYMDTRPYFLDTFMFLYMHGGCAVESEAPFEALMHLFVFESSVGVVSSPLCPLRAHTSACLLPRAPDHTRPGTMV